MRIRLTTASVAVVIASCIVPVPAPAQWLKYPTPGIPRTAEGKPDLFAPAPRIADGKPDLSGLWRPDTTASANAPADLKPQPWAEALSKKRIEDLGRDDMAVLCLPMGPRVGMGVGKVIQTPNLLVMLLNDLTYRQVFLDGRELPQDPNPDWMGYSVGHWDGDTLVVESAGFNDRTWLDGRGHPHTEALHVTERFRRRDFGHMEVQMTFDDPKSFTQPWTVPIKLELNADTEQLEYVCAENERDRQHLVGKASDEKTNEIKVAPEILSIYSGTYETELIAGRPIVLNVSLDGDQLMVSVAGQPKLALTPLSETRFSLQGSRIEFVKDGQGTVTHLMLGTVEGDFKAVRK